MALLPSDLQKHKPLLLIALPLLLLFAYWYLLYTPGSAKVQEMQTRLDGLTSKNAAAKLIIARTGGDVRKKLALYEQQMTRLEQLIPRSDEVPELLHAMTMRAEDSGVELTVVRPRPAGDGEFYTQQVYDISIVGPYDGVGRFLAAVGSLPRIVTPINLKMARLGTQTDRSGAAKLEADFQVETYVMPSDGDLAGLSSAKNANADT